MRGLFFYETGCGGKLSVAACYFCSVDSAKIPAPPTLGVVVDDVADSAVVAAQTLSV